MLGLSEILLDIHDLSTRYLAPVIAVVYGMFIVQISWWLCIATPIGLCVDAFAIRILLELEYALTRYIDRVHRSAHRLLDELSPTSLEHYLNVALINNEFSIVYQPQVSIRTGRVVGVEALIRWDSPVLGRVSPVQFVPIAESSGLIIPIGEWVLRTAVGQMKDWTERGINVDNVAVNVSAIQLQQSDTLPTVFKALDEIGLRYNKLELELTESAALDSEQQYFDIMSELHARGVQISIDDFGTGYSSLGQLRRFKCHKLKIDKSFVRNIDDPIEKAIIKAIIELAHTLGYKTIAEGVETQLQLDILTELGCEEAQGYYFSKPLTPSQFEQFLIDHQA